MGFLRKATNLNVGFIYAYAREAYSSYNVSLFP